MARGTNNRNNNNNQVINITKENPSSMGISFNYSENFNHITELTVENFVTWRTNILYLLCINNLDEYISTPKIKKIKRRDVNNRIEEYIIDKFDPTLVYDIGTTEKDIKMIY